MNCRLKYTAGGFNGYTSVGKPKQGKKNSKMLYINIMPDLIIVYKKGYTSIITPNAIEVQKSYDLIKCKFF